ncbi:MAG: DUF348 domain-containing protein [Armatimonadetes bacterium]|nr:DUF348 domain-containing protein [Armatimonadota bacterium]
MSYLRTAALRLLLPACVLCLVLPGLGRAQNGQEGGEATAIQPTTIQVDGQTLAVRLDKGTVADALQAAAVELGSEDECLPEPNTPLRPGLAITVHRALTRIVTQTQRIPAGTQVKPSHRLRAGITLIQQHPRDGEKELTYQVTSRNGKILSRQLLGSRVVRPARAKVIVVGGGRTRLPSRSGYFSGRRVITMVASGYPAMVTGTGRTYLGMKARKGIVAVDPRVIPLGARVYVEGYGEAVAGDIGSAIKGNRIDLCFATFREAVRYGKKKVKVWILSR